MTLLEMRRYFWKDLQRAKANHQLEDKAGRKTSGATLSSNKQRRMIMSHKSDEIGQAFYTVKNGGKLVKIGAITMCRRCSQEYVCPIAHTIGCEHDPRCKGD